MAKTEPELREEFEKYAARESWGAWLIVAALVAEAYSVWQFHTPDKSLVEAIFLAVANLAIAAGVYAEIHFGRKAHDAAASLHQFSDERVAAAEARAAEANQKAEEERSARVKFESERAWRSLTHEQHDEIAAALRKFSGQKFRLLTYIMDLECNRFANQVLLTLQVAGWIADSRSTEPMEFNLRFIKLGISDDAMLEPSYAFMDALRGAGFECATVGNPAIQPDVIEIRIGRKPERAAF